jgi:hypothetical protein
VRADRGQAVRERHQRRALGACLYVRRLEQPAVGGPGLDGAEKISGRVAHAICGERLVEVRVRLGRGGKEQHPAQVVHDGIGVRVDRDRSRVDDRNDATVRAVDVDRPPVREAGVLQQRDVHGVSSLGNRAGR